MLMFSNRIFKKSMSKTTYTALLLASLLISCGDENAANTAEVKDRNFISADSINTLSAIDLKTVASLGGQPDIAALVKHAVTTYKIYYQTTYQGKRIEASGLLYIPQDLTEAAPLISLQHGTTFVKDKAPSVAMSFTGMEYFGAAGYIAIMPDFIGYGASSELFHPYYDRQHSASAVIDMIKSTKEFLDQEKIQFNEQLFLAGYSEGGYVTLATAAELENNYSGKFAVTAVAAGAGGYDLNQMLDSITTSKYYSYPSYLAFVLMSYNTTYNWNKPLNYFFQDKYAEVLKTYMNGSYDGWQINNRLTTDVTALLNPDFLERLRDPNGERELKDALNKNSVSGWDSALPIRLYHGTRDEIIPYQNSELTLDNFVNAGSENVELKLFEGGTHSNSFIPMLQDVIPWFENMKK
jgi:alpha-beta hydrolase superfamily lysophospholipase